MNEKCSKFKDINFNRLEIKKMEFAEAKANLEKEEKLTQERVDSLNRKLYNEFMSVNKMAEMYGLNQVNEQPKEEIKCCNIQRPSFFEKNKNTILFGIAVVLVLILALGISPTGGWWDVLQTSYVELLVDMFKMGSIVIIFILMYKLSKQ